MRQLYSRLFLSSLSGWLRNLVYVRGLFIALALRYDHSRAEKTQTSFRGPMVRTSHPVNCL